MPVDDWDSDYLEYMRSKQMIDDLKAIARNVGWKVVIVTGELVSLALTKESNDIINNSHFRNSIITTAQIPAELELIANLVCKKDDVIVGLAGTYNGKQWGVIVE